MDLTQNAVVDRRLDRDELRGALYRADVDALGSWLVTSRDWPFDALQLLGDAVLMAVRERGHDIEPAARRCVRELRDRDWDGDAELATQIEATFGWAPTPLLRSLPVDLEEVAGVLEGDPLQGGGRIDLRTGEVWPESVWEYTEETSDADVEDEDYDEHWLWVHCEGSRAGYRDMELFIDLVEDPQLADRLAWSIRGRGAFRWFKDVLAGCPDPLGRWYGFSNERHYGRARAWLAAEGYAPGPNRDLP